MALYKAAHQLLNLDHGGTVGPVPLSIVGVFKGLDKQASIAPPPLQSSSSAAVLSLLLSSLELELDDKILSLFPFRPFHSTKKAQEGEKILGKPPLKF